MSVEYKQYLFEAYSVNDEHYRKGFKKKSYLQIDDQNDYDNISEFCNIFINFKRHNSFEIELIGAIPITREIADLAEIYHGSVNNQMNTITLQLSIRQVEVLNDLTAMIRKTSSMGKHVDNPYWEQNSIRTANSIADFIRITNEYIALRRIE